VQVVACECVSLEILQPLLAGRRQEQAESQGKRLAARDLWQMVLEWAQCKALDTAFLPEVVQQWLAAAPAACFDDFFTEQWEGFPAPLGSHTASTMRCSKELLMLLRKRALIQRLKEELLLLQQEKLTARRYYALKLQLLTAWLESRHALSHPTGGSSLPSSAAASSSPSGYCRPSHDEGILAVMRMHHT
jgi:hypothetical protein